PMRDPLVCTANLSESFRNMQDVSRGTFGLNRVFHVEHPKLLGCGTNKQEPAAGTGDKLRFFPQPRPLGRNPRRIFPSKPKDYATTAANCRSGPLNDFL